MNEELDMIFEDASERMDNSISHFERALTKLRAGKASPGDARRRHGGLLRYAHGFGQGGQCHVPRPAYDNSEALGKEIASRSGPCDNKFQLGFHPGQQR